MALSALIVKFSDAKIHPDLRVTMVPVEDDAALLTCGNA